MNILITGHKGLIGQEIFNRLKLFCEVTGYDRGSKDFSGKFDLIIHAAANCIIRDTIKDPDLAVENIVHTYNIMEYARKTGCNKVVIFSSGRVTHSEKNPYIVSKIFAENLAQAYFDCYGIEYMIIRPETVWGFNDHKVRVIPAWIIAAMKGKPIVVYGDKNKELPPIYVDDFVKVCMNFINNWPAFKNRILKINGAPLKVTRIIEIIKQATGSKSKVKFEHYEITQPQQIDNGICFGNEKLFIKRIEEVVQHGNITNNFGKSQGNGRT